jgi:FkbM family methyltransferase
VTLPEFTYTVLLRPKPLRACANAALRAIIPTETHVSGASIALNPRDPVVSGALTLGVYEKPETKVFLQLCRPGTVFLDIGANIGYYTALAMPILGPAGKIVAMEPDEESFAYLQRTVQSNHGPEVTLVKKAAGERKERATLFVSSENRGDSRLYKNELSNGEAECETIPVDELLAELDVQQVDLIKMDVQGFEGHAIAGMDRLLRESTRIAMMFEFWPAGLAAAGSDAHALLRHLRELSFDLFEITPKGTLALVGSDDELIQRFPGRKYTNLVIAKGQQLHQELFRA